MDRRIKRILILFFAILFFLGCPMAIFYSQGYRFDFETKKIVKTGAFSFKTQPKQCGIYLDGELRKKTDFIFGEAFVKDLLPKKYNVKIEKEGYSLWEKNLEIKKESVTKAENVLLFPKNLNFSLFLSNIENYFFSPDEKKIILKKSNEEGWELEILDLEKNIHEVILEEKELTKKETRFLDLSWSPDSRKALLKIETEEGIEYFVIAISETAKIQIFSLEHLGNIRKVSFGSRNSQEIFFLQESNKKSNKIISLLKVNYSKKELAETILENLVTYKISNGNIFWLSPDGFLYKSDFSGRKLEVLNTEPFLTEKDLECKIEIFPQVVFLEKNGNLFKLNSSSKTFEKFSESIKNLKLSPDAKKLSIGNSYEIWILFLADIFDQPQRELGQKIFLTRFSQEIKQIFWLNSNYLIFNAGDKIKIAEIDDRDRINIIESGEFENPKIFWNQEFKKIYVLSDKNLYFLENLLP